MNLNDLKKSSSDELARTANELGIKTAANADNGDLILAILRSHAKAGGVVTSSGTLEILSDGFGFLRGSKSDYSPSPQDIYVSPSQIRRFHLNTGDDVSGQVRPPKESERYFALLRVETINGVSADKASTSQGFTEREAVRASEQLKLAANSAVAASLAALCPLGKGQRALLLTPRRCRSGEILLELGKAARAANKKLEVCFLLVSERPELVTEFQKAGVGEVVFSTFDEPAQKHAQIADMVLENVKRSADAGNDVLLLVDSLTRLASAASLAAPGVACNLPSALSARGVHSVKRLFAAGRNLAGSGSVTLVATLREDQEEVDAYLRQELTPSANALLVLSRAATDAQCPLPLDIERSTNEDEAKFLSAEQLATLASRRARGGADLAALKALEEELTAS